MGADIPCLTGCIGMEIFDRGGIDYSELDQFFLVLSLLTVIQSHSSIPSLSICPFHPCSIAERGETHPVWNVINSRGMTTSSGLISLFAHCFNLGSIGL